LKYLEELQNGEAFYADESHWLVTADFKNSGKRLCYSLRDGYAKWFDGNTIINLSPIYSLDKDNNIIPIREYKNENNKLS